MPKPIGKAILTKGGIEAYKNAAVKSASIKPKYFKFSDKEYNLDDAFNFTDADIKGWWIKEDITAYLPIDDNTIEYLCEVKPDKAEKFCALCGIYLEDGALIALAKPPYSFPPNVAQRFKIQVTYGNLNKLTDFKYIPFEEIKRDLSKFDAQISLSDQIIKLSDEIEKIKAKLFADTINKMTQNQNSSSKIKLDFGEVSIEKFSGTFCKNVAYNLSFNSTPRVVATINHRDYNDDSSHDPVIVWLERKNNKEFRLCVREVDSDGSHDQLYVDWIAIGT
jgi:hypothetical protein